MPQMGTKFLKNVALTCIIAWITRRQIVRCNSLRRALARERCADRISIDKSASDRRICIQNGAPVAPTTACWYRQYRFLSPPHCGERRGVSWISLLREFILPIGGSDSGRKPQKTMRSQHNERQVGELRQQKPQPQPQRPHRVRNSHSSLRSNPSGMPVPTNSSSIRSPSGLAGRDRNGASHLYRSTWFRLLLREP